MDNSKMYIILGAVLLVAIILGTVLKKKRQEKINEKLENVKNEPIVNFKLSPVYGGYFQGHVMVLNNEKAYDLNHTKKLAFYINNNQNGTTYLMNLIDEEGEALEPGTISFGTIKMCQKLYDLLKEHAPHIELLKPEETNKKLLDVAGYKR